MNDFAASPGQVGDLSSSGLKNEFSNLPGNNVDSAFNSDRVQPRQVATGVMRGTQRIVNTDGSYITLGEIPGSSGEFGIAFFNRDGDMIFKMTGTTQTLYGSAGELYTLDNTGFLFSDSTDRRIKIGSAPDDGRVGIWQSEPGEDVVELLGGS